MHATCDVGFEEVLAQELMAIGAQGVTAGRRGVSFAGDTEMLWRANLQSRLANRVLAQVDRFTAPDRDAMYASVRSIPWERWIDVDSTLAVDSRIQQSPAPEQLVNQVVKDAVCDRFRTMTGRRPSVDRKRPDLPINVHLTGENCVLSVDSSGARLHHRGYRKSVGPAPLRETTAAGILAKMEWDPDTPLVDPMCGSGTFLIEAALLARNVPPGLLRLGGGWLGFAFQRWNTHEERDFEALIKRLRSRIYHDATLHLYGSDHNPRALSMARRNAAEAGVGEDCRWRRCGVEEARPPEETAPGLLITNPPYGERLGAVEDLEGTYRALGDALKTHFPGYRAGVLAGERALAGCIGLKVSRRMPVFNGPIECRLLSFELYAGTRRHRPPSTGEVPPAEADPPDAKD